MGQLAWLNPYSAMASGAIGAIGGAIGGSQGQEANQNQSYTVNPNISSNGSMAGQYGFNGLNNFYNLAQGQAPYLQQGPQQYAQMLQQYSQNGGLPNQQQIGYANQYAQNIFAPQQAQLNNVFQQSQMNTNRQAAAMGRSVNDPILQAKLAQYQGQQQSVLGGQQTALASQVAGQLPQQQLGYAQALSNAAFQNQQNVLGLGTQYLQNQQNYALAAAGRFQNSNGVFGGGTAGGIAGGIGGLAGGLNVANSLGWLNPTKGTTDPTSSSYLASNGPSLGVDTSLGNYGGGMYGYPAGYNPIAPSQSIFSGIGGGTETSWLGSGAAGLGEGAATAGEIGGTWGSIAEAAPYIADFAALA